MRTIDEIAEDARTQDNRCTDLPIFIVEQKRRIYGMDPEFATEGKVVWLFDGEVEIDPDEINRLDEEYASTEREPVNHTRTGYIDQWEFVTACFTENGCKAYLEVNGHNLREPRIYVASGYRNNEWEAVRDFLVAQKVKVEA